MTASTATARRRLLVPPRPPLPVVAQRSVPGRRRGGIGLATGYPRWRRRRLAAEDDTPAVLDYAALVASHGATAHWDFRDGTTSTDTIGGLVATPSGGVSLVDGPLAENSDKGVALDGTGLIVAPESAKPGASESFTLEAWAYTAFENGPLLFDFYDRAFTSGGDFYITAQGALAFDLQDDLAHSVSGASGDGVVTANAWCQVGLRVNRATGEASFFANGAVVGSPVDISAITGSLHAADSLGIGDYVDGGQPLTGTLAHPAIYVGTVSTPEQIAERYARRAGA